MLADIEIRPLRTHEDMTKLEELQLVVWPSSEIDVVPGHISQHTQTPSLEGNCARRSSQPHLRFWRYSRLWIIRVGSRPNSRGRLSKSVVLSTAR